MRKALAFAAAALLLAGCDSLGELNSDAFEPGAATQSRFTLDAANCKADAEVRVSSDILGITGTRVEQHERFNDAYTACMRRSGYARRGWTPDIPLPYDFKP